MPKFNPWTALEKKIEADRLARESDAEWQKHLAEKRASEIRSDVAAGIRDAEGNFDFSTNPPEAEAEDEEDDTP